MPWPPEPPRGQCEKAITWGVMRMGGHAETKISQVFSFTGCVRRAVRGSGLNVWLFLSPEAPLNTDLPSFLNHKVIESLNFL